MTKAAGTTSTPVKLPDVGEGVGLGVGGPVTTEITDSCSTRRASSSPPSMLASTAAARLDTTVSASSSLETFILNDAVTTWHRASG